MGAFDEWHKDNIVESIEQYYDHAKEKGMTLPCIIAEIMEAVKYVIENYIEYKEQEKCLD